jgi:hypothetical protein
MQAKKTSKKTAKKTYPSTKKKLPQLKRMTLEEFMAVTAENHAKTEASIDRLSAAQAKTEAKTEVAFERWEAAHAKTEASIDRLSAEHAKTEKALQKMIRSVDELSRNLGVVTNRLGSVVEFIVVPKIRLAMNAAGGHTFDCVDPDVKIRTLIDDVKKDVAQMDVFLYNDTEAMAVEIKTTLQEHDVNDHLDRLRKVRAHEETVGIAGKKLFGAVAGVIVDSKAQALALKNGLYVVKIREEEEKLDIEKPDSCRTW